MSAVGAVVLGFAGVDTAAGGLLRAAVLLSGLLLLLWLSRSRPVDRILQRLIERLLRRWTDLEVRDYTALLHLRGPWRIVRMPVTASNGLASSRLDALSLPDDGLTVLGIERSGGGWDGAPAGDARVDPGDDLVLYGQEEALAGLTDRPVSR